MQNLTASLLLSQVRRGLRYATSNTLRGVSPKVTVPTLPTWTRVHDALCGLNGSMGCRPKDLSHCFNKERATAIVDSIVRPHDPIWTP
jgi:hypothetical protein